MAKTGTCYIISAGDFFGKPERKRDDMIIAADAGLSTLESIGETPDTVIGDFDSLGYEPKGKSVIRLPVKKNDTDTFAAVKIALEKGYKKIVLLGCVGGKRTDHFLANLHTLVFASKNGAKAFMIGNNEVFTALTDSEMEFAEAQSGYVSVFGYSDECLISIKGLLYETENTRLTNSVTLGTSNEFIGKEAKIEVKNGSAVICWQGDISLVK